MTNADFSLVWSILVPAFILLSSLLLTLWLYWTFTGKSDSEK